MKPLRGFRSRSELPRLTLPREIPGAIYRVEFIKSKRTGAQNQPNFPIEAGLKKLGSLARDLLRVYILE